MAFNQEYKVNKQQQQVSNQNMGQQPSQPESSKKSCLVKNQPHIEGLYQMYNESIRLSKLLKSSSSVSLSGVKNGIANRQRPLANKKVYEESEEFLDQLLISFQQKTSYKWGLGIRNLFKKHFKKNFYEEWYHSKQLFYQLLLQNAGVQLQNKSLVERSHLNLYNMKKNIQKPQDNDKGTKQQKQDSQQKQKKRQKDISYEDYFHKVVKQRSEFNFRASVMQTDLVDRKQQEDIIYEGQIQKISMEDQLNYINCSIIDADEQGEEVVGKSQPKESKEDDDDQYFLPLITKRLKNRKKVNLSDKIQQQFFSYQNQNTFQIQMSRLPSKVKYSKNRIQTSSVILPSTIFYDRMNFTAKVETDQLLGIYRQISNTIQQSINSCNLISCPLKHFLTYFDFKTTKKNISQGEGKSQGNLSSINTQEGQTLTHDNLINSSRQGKQGKQLIDKHSPTQSSLSMSSNYSTSLQDLLIQTSPQSQVIRKKREFNTNMLLNQIKQFAQAYTQFLFKYLGFSKMQETDLEKFINLDTVYGIVFKNIWNVVGWLAERGWEWEEYRVKEVVEKQSQGFQTFTEEQIQEDPMLLVKKFAKFISKDIKKVKIEPMKLKKAYYALMKLKGQLIPQKYLKKIIIFYRQATNCCQGADDLMNVYQFLLKNVILSNLTSEIHLFRMKNLIDKLVPIQSANIEGAGQIVYAWTTWNIVIQIFLMKLNEYKKQELKKSQIKKQAKNTMTSQSPKHIHNSKKLKTHNSQTKTQKKYPGIKQNYPCSQKKKHKII